MKTIRDTNIENKLFEVAMLQNGYFTSNQAKIAGYKYRNFGYYVSRKHWIPITQFVYRLNNYPVADDEQYTVWSLWIGLKKMIPIGVYSYLTALSYYDLSEVIPSKLHMTVPKSFRTTKKIPRILILHRENVDRNDVEYIAGYGVTKPYKTLLDLARTEMMEREHLAQAVLQAMNRGFISKSFILSNPEFNKIIEFIKKYL